jgi:tetratricopeptide (TPR) repeat protein
MLALKRGRPEQAVAAFTRSLELQAGNSYTLGVRAEAYWQLGRFAEALADLDAILAAEPGHAVSHARRARILIHQGRGEDALAAIDRAIAADPGNFMLLTGRGEVLLRLGRQAEATAAYQSALALFDRLATAAGADGAESTALNQPRIALLIKLGRHAEAIAAADSILRRFPGTVMMFAVRCYIRVEANVELGLAQRDCDQAIRAEPGHPVAVPARALLNLRQRRWPDAIRDFSSQLTQEPRSANALYGRGLARIASGDLAGGQADIAAARRVAFDIDWDFRRLGIATAPD